MNKAYNGIITFFLICLFASFCGASTETKCDDPCGKPTAWDEFNKFELKVTTPKDPSYGFWKGQFDKESMDSQIDVETSDGKNIVTGKILMVGGRIMATQGPITEPGYEIDALDAAVLEFQLVRRLLGRSLPKGPTDVHGQRKVDFSDEKTGIKFATPSAEGFIAPPWSVIGDVKVVAPDVIDYHLTLTAASSEKPTGHGGEHVMNFTGRLSRIASAKIDDDMPLDGWNVLGVGVQTRKQGNATVVDYGAAPATATYKKVADLRRKIAEDDYPGEPDPTKDFTGFWKKKCEDAWGLQIMHQGTEGKYSVLFCGPGGCDEHESSGDTFITGDKHYQVVNENEIKTPNGGGWETYRKCTKDMRPVLKYKEQ